MSIDGITIRKAETITDYRACQDAQRLAWGISDDSYVVPLATMVGAQEHGGLVLGAFRPSGEAVGLSFAFLGKVDGRVCLYSQLTGVVPEFQGKGLGGLLKSAQRDFARSEGIPRLAWSFDPLQAGNARFNLARLGAVATRLIPDMYGRRTDALNANATTDRLIAEWATVPEERTPLTELADSTPRLIVARDRPEFDPGPINEEAPLVLLEIPEDVASLRRDHPDLAEAWSLAVRNGFQATFARGYQAVDFAQSHYVMRIKSA